MNRKCSIIVVVILSVIFLYGCGENDSSNIIIGPQDQDSIETEIMSLEPGDMWVYDFRHFYEDSIIFQSPDSMIIDSTHMVRGIEWCVLREQLGDVSSHNYYRQADDGIRSLYIEHGDTTEGLLFKYPVEPGDVWLGPDLNRNYLMCTSTSDTITVPIGTFENCIHYRYVDDDDDEGMWIKPGTGWIQSMWREGENTFWFCMQELLIN